MGNVKASYNDMQAVADKLKTAPNVLPENFNEVISLVKKGADDSGSEALKARYDEMLTLSRDKIVPAADILKNVGIAIEVEIKALKNADRA